MPVEIREASDSDVSDLAALRWQWHAERHDPVGSGFADFERGFARWWAEKGTRFRVVLASDGSEVVGMGFLALVNRVPGPDDLDRHHGDIQSMYVARQHRGMGLGSELLRALLGLATDTGCNRVEVHSGRRAVAFYERAGFEHFPQLMNHHLDG